MGLAQRRFTGWRSKYGGLEVSEAKRLKQLEDENSKLKRIVADLSLDKEMRWCKTPSAESSEACPEAQEKIEMAARGGRRRP